VIGRIFLTLALLQAISFGFDDDDFDGIENKYDKCLSTTLFEIVDEDGCTIQNLNPHLEYTFAFSFYRFEKDGWSSSQSLSTNIYYKNFDFEMIFSKMSNTENISNNHDSDAVDLNIFYQLNNKNDIVIWLGTGINLPLSKTNLNNKVDYSLYANFSKPIESVDLFSGLSYKITNDTDTISEKYRNTFGYYFGIKHYMKENVSYDLQYSSTQNNIVNEQSINYLYIGSNFDLTPNCFVRVEYGSGLSKTADDSSVGIKLEYVF